MPVVSVAPFRHAIVVAGATAIFATLIVVPALPQSVSASATRIPFIVDLLTARAVSTPEGDYESLRVVQMIDASGYRIVLSGEVRATMADDW